MGIWDVLAYASVAILVVGMVTFTFLYRRLLSHAVEEYENAREVVKGLVATLKKHQDEQRTRAEQISLNIEEAQAATDRTTIRLQKLEQRLRDLSRHMKTASTKNLNLTEDVKTLQREIQNITQRQEHLQRHVTTLDEKTQRANRLERIETTLNPETQRLTNLTETERQVLQMLIEEGPMTSPKVEKKIGKTREHTARLMKKLWQDGYVERDTHRMPFTYRPTKELKNLQKKTKDKKTEKMTPQIPKE